VTAVIMLRTLETGREQSSTDVYVKKLGLQIAVNNMFAMAVSWLAP
jgi:hypothetical protein